MRNKNLTLVFASIASMVLLLAFTNSPNPKSETSGDYMLNDFQQNWTDCITKVNSKWGGQCMNYGNSETKYTVYLVNTCTEKVDLMCAVQRDNDRWRVFYRMDMAPNDTLEAFACRGNGKYLKWVRKAGDVSVRFPTLDQVNEQY